MPIRQQETRVAIRGTALVMLCHGISLGHVETRPTDLKMMSVYLMDKYATYQSAELPHRRNELWGIRIKPQVERLTTKLHSHSWEIEAVDKLHFCPRDQQ